MESAEPVITSVHNRWVKYARSLDRRKARFAERAFLVEGVRLVADGLAAGAVPRFIFYESEAASAAVADTVDAAAAAGARAIPVTAPVVRAMSDTETPQGIVAVFPLPDLAVRIISPAQPLLVVADAVRDPGNVGTLIRSAAAAGAHALFVAPGTADPFAPKVVRAGMGAHFRLPVRYLDWAHLDPLLSACRQRLAAVAGGQVTYDAVDWTLASCLIVGNEAVGPSVEALAASTGTVAIPLAAGIESLNAAVAGSVVLFEAARQRRGQELRSTAD